MKAKITGFIIMGAMGATTIGITWKTAHGTHDIEIELAALAARHAWVAADLRRAETRIAAAEQDRIALTLALEKLEKLNQTAPAVPVTSAVAANRGRFDGSLQKETRNHPAVQNADSAAQRANWKWGYEAMFRTLRFSPEQIERYLDIEEKHYSEELNVLTASRAYGLPDRDPVVLALMREVEGAYEAAQRELVGADGYEPLQELRRAHLAQGLARGLGGMATMANMPLTAEQGEQIARIVVNATRRNASGVLVTPCDIDWDVVDAQTRAVLTEVQWKLFRTTEPPGGPARFVAQLNRAFMQAQEAETAIPPTPERP